jgi:hypothetical protein
MNENKIEIQEFTYSIFFRFFYRYSNFVVTILLILYSAPLIANLDDNKILFVPLIITLIVVYFINRHFFNLYKILPYKITADDEKIICTDFFASKKKMIIYYKDIAKLEGGTFDNKISGIMKVCDSNRACFGFYHKIYNINKLVTIILSKVKRELYDEMIEKLNKRRKGK